MVENSTKFRVQAYGLHIRMHFTNQNHGEPLNLKDYADYLYQKFEKKSPMIFGRYHVGNKGIALNSTAPTHFHFYVAVKKDEKKIDIKNSSFLDYKGCHPKILKAKGSPQKNWEYINKKEEPTEECKMFYTNEGIDPTNHWLNEYIKNEHDKHFVSKKSVEKFCYSEFCDGKTLIDIFASVQESQNKTFMLCKYKDELSKIHENYLHFLSDLEQRKMDKEFSRAYEEGQKKWQKTAEKTLSRQSRREIDVIQDPDGNGGKSMMAEYLRIKYKALIVDRPIKVDDLALIYKQQPYVVFDFAREIDVTKQSLCILESLKNGNILSNKYRGAPKHFQSPKIIVLTNQIIQSKQLKKVTLDRLRLYTLEGGNLDNTTEDQLLPIRNSKNGIDNIPYPAKDTKESSIDKTLHF